MDNFQLTAISPLQGVRHEHPGLSLEECTDLALVSAAVPLGGDAAFAAALSSGLGGDRPAVGRVTCSAEGRFRILGLQPDQVFILFPESEATGVATIAQALGDTGYYTDQSDSWAMLQLSGPRSRAVLEHLCPLDLHSTAFPADAVARTVMEHLAVIILADGPDRFLLLSPRSSAPSFLHAIEAAMTTVLSPLNTSG